MPTKAPPKPAEKVVDCEMCGGKRNVLRFVQAAGCNFAGAFGGDHLHRSCATCGYQTCEPVMGGKPDG
jgi:hypothetical protein